MQLLIGWSRSSDGFSRSAAYLIGPFVCELSTRSIEMSRPVDYPVTIYHWFTSRCSESLKKERGGNKMMDGRTTHGSIPHINQATPAGVWNVVAVILLVQSNHIKRNHIKPVTTLRFGTLKNIYKIGPEMLNNGQLFTFMMSKYYRSFFFCSILYEVCYLRTKIWVAGST